MERYGRQHLRVGAWVAPVDGEAPPYQTADEDAVDGEVVDSAGRNANRDDRQQLARGQEDGDDGIRFQINPARDGSK